MIDLKILIKNGVQFGHQTSRWHPNMGIYIWGEKNNIHLINVYETARLLEKAGQFLESVVSQGKSILWVGTKKAAREGVYNAAVELDLPYVINRWVGGTLTNYRQVKKSVSNLLHYEDILKKSDQFPYSKKELGLYQKRANKLQENVGGIRKLTWPVGAIVVVDIKREEVAVKEALSMGIPVVALVDTNSDPTGINYVIPANDDAPRSINVLLDYLKEQVKKGQAAAQERIQEEEAQEEERVYALEVDSEEEEGKKPVKKTVSSSKPKSVKKAVVKDSAED